MKYSNHAYTDLKIAYIGGGSRGWAWGFMSDLAKAPDICGEVALYDIDREAAKHNEIIGNLVKENPYCVSAWHYTAVDSLKEALTGADFVVISILPGTFDEMESDVHAPEAYGIYQSVGDTSGPGGIVRAMRTVPMYEEIALAIRDYAPKAWVINYTNPMTVCVNTLYRVFPEIKAFGCCHEVFGTQKLIASLAEDALGITGIKREEVKVNVVGVNHFTWLTKAQYKNIDLMPIYRDAAEKYAKTGYLKGLDNNWMNNAFACNHRVKFDLFNRYGAIAAAGDRHLAEFCPGYWYLKDPASVKEWGFSLTPVSWRKGDLKERLAKSARLVSGEQKFEIGETGEDGVNQIRALLGLEDMITNVNLPNVGQIPNLPLGAVVETNAAFTADAVTPLCAGNLPEAIYPLVARISGEQQIITEACLKRDPELAFRAFANDPLVTVPTEQARELFDKMVENTKKYLTSYGI